MKITFLQTGKTNLGSIEKLLGDYSARIKRYCDFESKEIPEKKGAKSAPDIKKHIPAGAYIILLDEKGKEFTSVQFAAYLEARQLENRKHLVFISGGAYGFPEELIKSAKEKIALSKMTFTHQLVRVIFVEQLYRAFTILNKQPYHH